DRSDGWHRRVREYVQTSPETLLAPATIIPEVAYLMRARIGIGAEIAFAAALATGELAVEDVGARDWTRAHELLVAYEWLGLVDATIIAIAERLKMRKLATTDRRHFGAVRPAHVNRLEMVP